MVEKAHCEVLYPTPESEFVAHAFAIRASKVKTRLQTKNEEAKQAQITAEKKGLTANEYWLKHVNSEESAFKFYQLYHPDYPELLQRALAQKITEIIVKYNNNKEELAKDELDIIERSLQQGKRPSQYWDVDEDIRQAREEQTQSSERT